MSLEYRKHAQQAQYEERMAEKLMITEETIRYLEKLYYQEHDPSTRRFVGAERDRLLRALKNINKRQEFESRR